MTSIALPEEFWQGVEQFNQQEFYACHDTLEALWMEAVGPEKRFYQGILQIAVSCHLLFILTWRGAVILLGEGIGRLRDYQPVYEEIDVTSLVVQSAQLLQALQESGQEQVENFVKNLTINQELDVESSREPTYRLPQILRVES